MFHLLLSPESHLSQVISNYQYWYLAIFDKHVRKLLLYCLAFYLEGHSVTYFGTHLSTFGFSFISSFEGSDNFITSSKENGLSSFKNHLKLVATYNDSIIL